MFKNIYGIKYKYKNGKKEIILMMVSVFNICVCLVFLFLYKIMLKYIIIIINISKKVSRFNFGIQFLKNRFLCNNLKVILNIEIKYKIKIFLLNNIVFSFLKY